MADDIAEQATCFGGLAAKTKQEGWDSVGLKVAGVSRSGYAQIRTGMAFDEVEFILGGTGEQISYSGGGGHSFALYRWVDGRAMVVLSFADDLVSGKSQSGL